MGRDLCLSLAIFPSLARSLGVSGADDAFDWRGCGRYMICRFCSHFLRHICIALRGVSVTPNTTGMKSIWKS